MAKNHFFIPMGRRLLPFVPLLPGALLILYYLLGPAAGYMTSDCTDSIRWAQATADSGHLISQDFSYAALLPFGGNLIFLPFIALFGYSMTAQVAGLLLFALLFMAALFYLARGLKLSPTASSVFVSLVILLLSLSPKLREIIWEHIFYYNLGILFFCLGFGLALRIFGEQGFLHGFGQANKRNWMRLFVLLLFSFLAATDGLQTLVCYTLPLLGAFLLEYFLYNPDRTLLKDKFGLCSSLMLILFWSLLGFMMIPLFSRGVSAGYANAYSTYSGMGEWMDNFLGLFHHWLTLCGVSVSKGDPLVSLDSVANMIKIAGALFLLTFPFVLLIRYRKNRNREMRLLLAGHLFVSAFIIFASVFGSLGKANWRLTPMLGTAIIVSVAWALMKIQTKRSRYGVLFLLLFICMAFLPASEIIQMPADYGKNDSWHVAARTLEEKQLHYGYANFWWSQRITLLSANQVQVASFNIANDQPSAYNYQQPKYRFSGNTEADSYFLLLHESDKKELNTWLTEQDNQGFILDSFELESDPYASGGFTGTKVYVYVFPFDFIQ